MIFFSSDDDHYVAYHMNVEEWNRAKGLIFLCEILKNKSSEEQARVIAHACKTPAPEKVVCFVEK